MNSVLLKFQWAIMFSVSQMVKIIMTFLCFHTHLLSLCLNTLWNKPTEQSFKTVFTIKNGLFLLIRTENRTQNDAVIIHNNINVYYNYVTECVAKSW